MIEKIEMEATEQPMGKPDLCTNAPTPTETSGDDEVILSESDFTPEFPVAEMNSMYIALNKFNWVVPVCPNQELETILLACIKLAETNQYERCSYFKTFCDRDLISAFDKIICGCKGISWNDSTRHFIFMNSLLAVKLCALMADKDYDPILELEARLFDPEASFHINALNNRNSLNAIRFGTGETETISRFEDIMTALPELCCPDLEKRSNKSQLEVFAITSYRRLPLLEDFINLFGRLGGFNALLRRFLKHDKEPLTLRLLFNYLKPFRACCYYLTDEVAKTYFLPIVDISLTFMKNLTDADVRQSIRRDQRNNHLADFAMIQCFYQRIYGHNFNNEEVDELRLELILKTLKMDLFGAKMIALTGLLMIINGSDRRPAFSANASLRSETITNERVVKWLKDNQVLSLLLRENLHQLQYVEKVTYVAQFLIEMHELSLEDLEEIWEAQVGKHEAIVKNVEYMLSNLVRYFTPEQLDRLFDCFKKAFQSTTRRQQERLIDLIRRLTVDNSGELASKALEFLWNIAIKSPFFSDVVAAALEAHCKILTHDCQALAWLRRFSDLLKEDSDDYVFICATRQIMGVYRLSRLYVTNPICQLTVDNDLIAVCIDSLRNYMCKYSMKNSKVTPDTVIDSISSQPPSTTSTLSRGDIVMTASSSTSTNTLEFSTSHTKINDDGGVNSQSTRPSTDHIQPVPHVQQIRDRLNLLSFLAMQSHTHLTLQQLNTLWRCLIVDTEIDQEAYSCADSESSAVCTSTLSSPIVEGRNVSLAWFDPINNQLVRPYVSEFFRENILKIKPDLLTLESMDLFRCFFKYVNKKLEPNQETYSQSQSDLVGLDYLWRIVLVSNDRVARVGIEMLREIYTKERDPLGDPRKLRSDFLKKCYDFLSSSYAKVHRNLLSQGVAAADSTVCRLFKNSHQPTFATFMRDIEQDLNTIDRVIRVLRCFLIECDRQFKAPRERLPLLLSWTGSSIFFMVTFNSVKEGSMVDCSLKSLGVTEGRQYKPSCIKILTHANETLGRLRFRLLVYRLNELIPSLDSSNTNAGGDEGTPSCSPKILDKFCMEISGDLGLPGNLCLSTFILLLSSDREGCDFSFDSSSFCGDMKSPISLSARLSVADRSPPSSPERPCPSGPSQAFGLIPGHQEYSPSSSMGNCSNSSQGPRGSLSSTPTDDENAQLPAAEADNGIDYPRNSDSDSPLHSGSSTSQGDSMLPSPGARESGKSMPLESPLGLNPSPTAGGDCSIEASTSPSPFYELNKECYLPDCVISEDLNFVHLLFDIGNVAVFLDINDLRDRTFDVLFSLPINPTKRQTLCEHLQSHEGIESLKGLFNCSTCELNLPCAPDKAVHGTGFTDITQLFYLLQVLYSILHPSVEIIFCIPNEMLPSRYFPPDNFRYTLFFLRNGGLKSLLTSSILEDAKSIPTASLSQLIFLWICRILFLCLYCIMATLWAVSGGDTVIHSGIEALWKMRPSPNPTRDDPILEKYAEAFAHFAVNSGVTMQEVQSIWLTVPPRSCELLRDIIWFVNSSFPEQSGALPLSAGPSAPPQHMGATAHSYDSGCISPKTDASCQPTPNVVCTFSTACGLKSTSLQTFFRTGYIDSSILSNECLRLLFPESRCYPSLVSLSHILNLHSGRTPGCLSTTALSTLSLLLSLSPDSSLVDLLLQEVSPSPDSEVLKSWLEFVRQILIFSLSLHLRQSAACCLNLVVPHGLTAAVSLQPVGESIMVVGTTEMVAFVIDFLVKALKEGETNQALYPADVTDVLINLLTYLELDSHILNGARELFVDEWAWLSKTITVPSIDSFASGSFPTPSHLATPDLFRSHLRLCSALIPFQEREIFGDSVKEQLRLGPVDALLQVVIFPAAPRFNELCERQLSGAQETNVTTSANDIVAVSKIITTPPAAILDASFNLLFKLSLFHPPVFLSFISGKICSLLYSPYLRKIPWEPLDPLSFMNRSYGKGRQHDCLSNNIECLGGSPGFVGLKNAGSTCYMNAVLQQLFAILPIRNAILSAPVSETLRKSEDLTQSQLSHVYTLFALQDMFAFLAYTRRKFYEPISFWRHFKFGDHPVNCAEQQDAQEFFSRLVDIVDEAMEICGMPKAIENVIGGTFEDQKTCLDCPHRYQKEESFLAISVEIQDRSNLCDSLEEYVKSDLLEGDNAYHCDLCDKKVTGRKRTCIKRLPQILTIHLKRFSYDWDRHLAIKSNDYFTFPSELDMMPYTVEGLASRDEDKDTGQSYPGSPESMELSQTVNNSVSPRRPTRYTLRGVVVHHGQASGGHYYSYILHRNQETGRDQWFKYDDTRVMEVVADSPGFEQKEWFGVERSFDYCYTYSRCWSAYMLFYEREDFKELSGVHSLCNSIQSIALSGAAAGLVPCPPHIANQIYAQNVEDVDTSMLVNPIFADFMYQLVKNFTSPHTHPLEDMESYEALMRLLTHFCFDSRFRLRENNWYLWLPPFIYLLQLGPSLRETFTKLTCFSSPMHVHDFFFQCPYAGVRYLYGIMLLSVARLEIESSQDKFVANQIMQKLIAEVPNSFNSNISDAFYGETPVYGPYLSPNFSFAYSMDDSRLISQHSVCGGQLLALLLDYAQFDSLSAEHLVHLNFHTKLISYLMNNLPNISVACRSSTFSTAQSCNAYTFTYYLEELGISRDIVERFPYSSRLMGIWELFSGQQLKDSLNSIPFLPPDGSPAFVSCGIFKSRLFQLSPSATLQHSPLNNFVRLLLCLFSYAQRDDSCLNVSEMLQGVDFDRFIQVIFTCCLNQGSVVTISKLVEILTTENGYRSRVVIDELMRVIFPPHSSVPVKLSSELAIPVFMEALSVHDSLQEFRLSYAFQKQDSTETESSERIYDVLTLTKRSNPKFLNDLGMNMLRALSSMVINFDAFREYFESQRHIGVYFRKIINDVLQAVECQNIHGAADLHAILHDAASLLPAPFPGDEAEEEDEDEENEETPRNPLNDTNKVVDA